jgi:Short C-terminal domain
VGSLLRDPIKRLPVSIKGVFDLPQYGRCWFPFYLYIVEAEECVMTDGCCCSTQTEAAKQPALEILKVRFARGEIDKAEFEERHQVLSNATPETPAAAANKGKGCC